MAMPCRLWWRNCAVHADPEILAIDAMEDRLARLGEAASKIRELISSLELCHHKAERWVYNIIEAIGAGETTKGLGTRVPGQRHPRETVWHNVCGALSAWCEGGTSEMDDLTIGTVPAFRFLACLGEPSPLKEWQVRRVIEKIRSVSYLSRSSDNPAAGYVWLLLSDSDYEAAYLNQCPELYREHEDFWLATVRTLIHDSEWGEGADLSLALAIDMLWPCHWRFVENLRIVLDAIGGKLNQETPFAACGRNIGMLPIRCQMEVVSNTLRRFYGATDSDLEVDKGLLALLGKPSEVKRWLAASLDKTIRLQLSPPAEIRVISALAGPEWIKQQSSL